MKVALVHDWLLTNGGAERVLHHLHEVFPSKIYTLFGDQFTRKATISSSYLNRFPLIKFYYPNLMPLYKHAISSIDFSDFDLIISSSWCMAKNIKKSPQQMHICYCHSPARYLWDLYEDYSKLLPWYKKVFFKITAKRLRRFDYKMSKSVDQFVANSEFVKERIQRIYHKSAKVVYPPVDTLFFTPGSFKGEEYFVTCSRLVPYKRVDLIIEAFKYLPDQRLIVLGEGPELLTLKKKSTSNVSFKGRVSKFELRGYFQKAKGFIYAAIEDFGIVMAEAISCGCPVIAFNGGGAKEIVKPENGILYPEQTSESITVAIKEFLRVNKGYSKEKMHEDASRYSIDRFKKEIREVVGSYIHSCGR